MHLNTLLIIMPLKYLNKWNGILILKKKIFIAFLRRNKCHATKIKKFIHINHLPLSNHRP